VAGHHLVQVRVEKKQGCSVCIRFVCVCSARAKNGTTGIKCVGAQHLVQVRVEKKQGCSVRIGFVCVQCTCKHGTTETKCVGGQHLVQVRVAAGSWGACWMCVCVCVCVRVGV